MLYQKIDKNTAGYEKIRAELMALQSRINIILGNYRKGKSNASFLPG